MTESEPPNGLPLCKEGAMATIYGNANANTLLGTAGDDVIQGLEGNDRLYGYAGNDRLYGGPGSDTLYGGLGNDYLNGGTGADLMDGGSGNDTYVIDSPYDQIQESAGAGIDTLLTSMSCGLPANVERLGTTNRLGTAPIDLYGNESNNVIIGNDGNNHIRGGVGADTLNGLGGNDLLIGDEGADRLTGGRGSDIFVFTNTDRSRDTITDFQHGIDKIDLGWWATDMGGTNNFHFINGAAFGHHAGEGRYADGLFQLDANGDGVADLTIALTGQLSASDFSFAAYGYWDY